MRLRDSRRFAVRGVSGEDDLCEDGGADACFAGAVGHEE